MTRDDTHKLTSHTQHPPTPPPPHQKSAGPTPHPPHPHPKKSRDTSRRPPYTASTIQPTRVGNKSPAQSQRPTRRAAPHRNATPPRRSHRHHLHLHKKLATSRDQQPPPPPPPPPLVPAAAAVPDLQAGGDLTSPHLTREGKEGGRGGGGWGRACRGRARAWGGSPTRRGRGRRRGLAGERGGGGGGGSPAGGRPRRGPRRWRPSRRVTSCLAPRLRRSPPPPPPPVPPGITGPTATPRSKVGWGCVLGLGLGLGLGWVGGLLFSGFLLLLLRLGELDLILGDHSRVRARVRLRLPGD